MREFKYTSTFASAVKCIISEEKDLMLSQASLNELKKSIPSLPSDNKAFLPVAFNAFIANRVNKNDDVIDTKTALAIYDKFINNPTNIEHKRHNVVGVIVSAGFSAFGSDKPLTYEEVKNMTTPFCVTLGAVVWKVINPEFASLLEESNDPTSDDFLSISASWELGFQNYKLLELDKTQKNIEGGKIISEASEIEKLSKNLRANGGTGILDDKRLYRMPSDEVFPLGIGFTQKPAAEVKGVAVQINNNESDNITEAALTGSPDYSFYFCPTCNNTPKKYLKVNDFGNIDCPNCKTTSPSLKWKPSNSPAPLNNTSQATKIENNNEKISQQSNSNVITERKQHMSIKSIKDITDENLKVATASQIADLVSSEIEKGNAAWLADKNKLVLDKEAVDLKLREASAETLKVQENLKQVQATVETLTKEKAEREAVEKFNVRMAQVAEAYEFDDEQKAVVASDIKAISTDEDFTKWEAKAKKMFKPFQKKNGKDAKDGKDGGNDNKPDNKDAKDAKDAQAATQSTASVVDTAIDNAKKDTAGVTNSSTATTPSMKEKYAEAFAMEQFQIIK